MSILASSNMFVANPAWDVLLRGLLLTSLAMVWVVLLVRLNGPRSFSKMTNFDFVMTVAVGSLLASASQSTSWLAYLQSLTAMVALFVVQHIVARLRMASDSIDQLVQNSPVILMTDGVIDQQALDQTRVAKDDLIAKLREANVLDFSQVRHVVLETTGDISVMHGDECDQELLRGTRQLT